MRTLYLKIFVWFWLAMALVGLVVVITAVTMQTGEQSSRWRPLMTQALSANGHRAAEIYERQGRAALARFFARFERNTRIVPYLFDLEGNELRGRRVRPEAIELARDVARNRSNGFATAPGNVRLIGRPVTGSTGNRYVIVGEMSRGGLPPGSSRVFFPFWRLFDEPQRAGVRLLIVFLTAGALCYGLARYLTAPVHKLRDATRRLSQGDLSVRVGPLVGSRRDELADLGRDFDTMAERIESLVTTQRRLLSDISHELRSPLARLGVALELARKKAGPETEDALERIANECERLNELITQVLMLARLASGSGEAERTRVELSSLVEKIAADADYEAKGRNRRVRVVGAEACATFGSEELLGRAIENVIRNAVLYTAEESEVEINLEQARADGASFAAIRVRDHGPGVPSEALADLFRPFYRVADARDRESGGTGLGLAISERAVRLHGGTVKASNAADGGLVVEIRLPTAS